MRLVKNFISLATAEVVSKVVTFAAFAYLARVLGPDGFGFVEFSAAVLLCAGLIVDQGFGYYGAREISKAPNRTQSLTSQVIAARVILAVPAYVIVVALALFIDKPPIVTRLLLLYGLSLLAMPFLLQWVFQGHEQMRTVAVLQLLRQTIFALVVFAVVRNYATISWIAIAEVAGVTGAAGYGLWLYRRRFGAMQIPKLRISRQLFREGVPIGVSQMFWVVKMFGATVILGFIATAEDLGYFAAAMRILIAVHAFVWLYYFNLLPSMSREWQQERARFASSVKRSLHVITWVGVAGTIVWVLIARAVMSGVYGRAFSPAGSTLQWLAGVCVMAAINGHYRFGLIATGRQTAEMVTAAMGAISAAILIPIGYAEAGPQGAAIALCLAEIIVWMSSWGYSRQVLGLSDHSKLFVRPVLAASFSAAMLWLLPVYSLTARVLLVCGTVTALAFTLDVVVRDKFCKLRLLRQLGPEWLSKRLPEVTQ